MSKVASKATTKGKTKNPSKVWVEMVDSGKDRRRAADLKTTKPR